ncbi:hypothetical protein [Klebsiella variicola]|uniref:hypothetical protein n=1 Tax=Klebsiella variicola TaxID=244366 RepID=UPI002ACBC646|nr:hypothetical protein [Klebsiella pneumoniae]
MFSLALIKGVIPFNEKNTDTIRKHKVNPSKKDKKHLSEPITTKEVILSKFTAIAAIMAEAKLSNIVDLVLA